jgi:hypothetical protein
MRKYSSRKNISRKNKKNMKNIKKYSRKNNINKMKGGDAFNQELLGRIFNNDSSLTKLELSNQNIDNDGAIALANVLKNNNEVTSINLSNNNISDKGALAILESITITQKKDIKPKVNYLDFSRNKIGTGGFFSSKIKKIKNKLAVNYILTFLDLNGNIIESTDDKLVKIFIERNKYLKNNPITKDNFKDIIKQMHETLLKMDEFSNYKGLLEMLNWSFTHYDINLNILNIQK